MPISLLRLVGIFLACCACSLPVVTEPVPPEATPSATAEAHTAVVPGRSNAPWPLQLALTGDIVATVAATSPGVDGLVSECTGKNSLRNGAWSSTFLMPVPGGTVALVAFSPGYNGAGAYSNRVSVQVHNTGLTAVWQNREGDAVTWTVGPDEESGRIDATLTNLATPTSKLAVAGTWTCRT